MGDQAQQVRQLARIHIHLAEEVLQQVVGHELLEIEDFVDGQRGRDALGVAAVDEVVFDDGASLARRRLELGPSDRLQHLAEIVSRPVSL